MQDAARGKNILIRRYTELEPNVTTLSEENVPIPNVAPFIGNASINETSILLNEWVCLNATAHDPEGNPITVTARVWNTTNFVNYTMADFGQTGCDGIALDNIYGVEVQGLKTGTWNFSHAMANDSETNFNITIVNRRWNVSSPVAAMPQITNIDFDDDFNPNFPNEIDLIAFGTRNVFCNGTVTDADGGSDIIAVNATIYDVLSSSSDSPDNNATHYTNRSCWLSAADGNNKYFECLFLVRYFANNATWQCNATAYDSSNLGSNTTNATINELIAVDIPTSMNFGSLYPGDISFINKTNITNAGNIQIDLKVYGYANNATTSPNAMNCTGGEDKNISLWYLHYNVTDNIPGPCMRFQWNAFYWNLTNITNEKTWPNFDLGKQTQEGELMRNVTCWALKISTGVAGTCKGKISFTAIKNV